MGRPRPPGLVEDEDVRAARLLEAQPYAQKPTDLQIGADDIVFCDFGPIFEEWEADFGRTYVLGGDPVKLRLRDDLPVMFDAGRRFFAGAAFPE